MFMKSKLIAAMVAAAVVAPAMVPVVPAIAQDRRAYDREREYRGRDRNYYQDCKKSKGTTGLVAGGVGGALVGNAVGGGTLGTVAGGIGGALLGKHLDKKNDAAQNRRNGC
jgi:uncharacterized protein YcfJ